MFVQEKYIPVEGEHKEVEVYKCINSWGESYPRPDIPVNYPGNMLYCVDVKYKPFGEDEDTPQNNGQVEDVETKQGKCLYIRVFSLCQPTNIVMMTSLIESEK